MAVHAIRPLLGVSCRQCELRYIRAQLIGENPIKHRRVGNPVLQPGRFWIGPSPLQQRRDERRVIILQSFIRLFDAEVLDIGKYCAVAYLDIPRPLCEESP